MRPNRRATNIPVRWQPYAELTAAAAAAACGGEGSILDTSLLGGGRSSGIVERNLLSQFKGDAKMQVTDDRPEPSLALSLRVGSEEEPQPQNRLRHAPTRQSPSLLSRPAGSSVPPQTYYAPASSPAGAGLAPQLQLGSNSLPLPLPLGATPPGARAALRRVQPPLRSFGGGLAEKGERGPRSQGGVAERSAEVRNEVLRLHAAAAAAAATEQGSPLPAAAFSAAGLPQPQQPCGGAWRWCPACGARPGTVVLKPYEHICVCAQCSDASRLCLHCYCSFTWTGAVEAASRGRGRGCGRGGL